MPDNTAGIPAAELGCVALTVNSQVLFLQEPAVLRRSRNSSCGPRQCWAMLEQACHWVRHPANLTAIDVFECLICQAGLHCQLISLVA